MSKRKRKSEDTEPLLDFNPEPLNIPLDTYVPKSKKAPVRPPVTAHPDTEARVTVEVYVRGKGVLGSSFRHQERLRSGVRKLTKAEWDAEYERFLKAPR